jgi:hypothetical protein
MPGSAPQINGQINGQIDSLRQCNKSACAWLQQA